MKYTVTLPNGICKQVPSVFVAVEAIKREMYVGPVDLVEIRQEVDTKGFKYFSYGFTSALIELVK